MEHGVCRVQYSAEVDARTDGRTCVRTYGRVTPMLGSRDRPLENSPLLEFVCSMWSAVSPGDGVHPGAPGSFEISKWINFIDRARRARAVRETGQH